ncbi:MAG: hypothetical protein ACP5VR_00405 [Acidimicrobiales bacterium]
MQAKTVKPALFVFLSVVLSAPTLANILAGSVSAVSAGAHLVGAILISWAAVGTLSYLVSTYRASVAHQQHQQERHDGPAPRS